MENAVQNRTSAERASHRRILLRVLFPETTSKHRPSHPYGRRQPN